MSQLEGELLLAPHDLPLAPIEGAKKKLHPQQPRQLLSCTKCRERKVKCDRTKPCFACCARGAPKECHFIAEGGDYAPIQQSYELRKLRAENLRLKDRLRNCRIPIEDEDEDYAASPESQVGERSGSAYKRRVVKQKRFQGTEWNDSIYFGTPALCSVMSEFASVNVDAAITIAHLMPRVPDMHAPRTSRTYPFPTLFSANPDECIPQLLSCLPAEEGELSGYLDTFENRINSCLYPEVPIDINRSEFDSFLSDPQRNAQICPDMLALLFAVVALGAQHSVWDKGGRQWDPEVMRREINFGDVLIAAAMQALRLASFMHRPSLLGIQTLILIGPYLTNSGRFLDAWTLFGTTIRLAHSIGLHRHPKYLNPAPSTQKDCSIRQRLWWWMLRMDEQYSMTLGRPLGISGLGDCTWPQELTTDPIMLRFGDFVNRFTVVARRILSSDRLTTARIDEYTDDLTTLLATMPETLQYREAWNHPDTDAPEWPLRATAAMYHCKTHTYLILLNRQRVEKQPTFPQMPGGRDQAFSFRPINTTHSSHPLPTTLNQPPSRGRPLVLSSCEDVISTFMFFYYREPAALIDWSLGQQAFNAAMLLLHDAIETKIVTTGAHKAEQIFVIFKELDDSGIHELAGPAVDRLSWGMSELHKIVSTSSGSDHTQQAFGTEVQVAKDDASLTDTVMSNTGMLLLEDTGLQAFVSEPYTPITWPLCEIADLTKTRGNRLPTSANPRKGHASGEKSHIVGVRSSGGVQSTRRSTGVRSAVGLRHASAKPSYTSPVSPRSMPHGDQRQRQHHDSGILGVEHQQQRHLPQHLFTQMQGVPGEFEHLPHFTQLRHNSCPTIPHQQSTGDPPPIRPTYSSPSNVNRPTDLYSITSRDPAPAIYSTDRAAFATQFESDGQRTGYPYVTSATQSTLTPLVEDLSMEWKEFGGAGS